MFASFQTGVFLLVAILVYQEIAISVVSEHGSQYRKTRVVFKWCFFIFVNLSVAQPIVLSSGLVDDSVISDLQMSILWNSLVFLSQIYLSWCVNWFCCRVPSLVRNRGQDWHLHQCICYWFLPSGFLSLRFILFIVKLRRLISRLVIVWLDVSHFQ